MDIFGMLAVLGGLAMFLYGMDLMGKSLRRQAGNQMQRILERLTASPAQGFLVGLVATAIIQSSSATTVMVVGFVNSGIMKLHQATGIIMGANVGTTVTAWLLSLTSIEGESFLLRLLKPESFTPALAMAGAVLYLFVKRDKLKNIGAILLGFAILMFGMSAISDAVKPLADAPAFTKLFTLFSNPILGVLAGTALTAVLQSSSASVGILQALAASGAVPYSCAIPIIMGQNIGACAPMLLAAVGANRDARRAAMIRLYFNVIGVALFLALYVIVNALFPLPFSERPANAMGIAVVHTCFNLAATAVMLPFSRQLERLACLTVRDAPAEDEIETLDERLMYTPSVAVEQSRRVSVDMARTAQTALNDALGLVRQYDGKVAASVQVHEERIDRYEDMLGSYLVKLSTRQLSTADSREVSVLLHMIGDFERIGDHALNLMEVAQELHDKKLAFSESAVREIRVLSAAVAEALAMAMDAFARGDVDLARRVEPLEQVVDGLVKELKSRHIERLQNGACTIQMGFILSDFTNNCERVADHCSNIAATLIESTMGSFEMHDYTGHVVLSDNYRRYFSEYRRKYSLLAEEN